MENAASPELAKLCLSEPFTRLFSLLFIYVRPHNFNPMPRD
jgi:hypothetical protein